MKDQLLWLVALLVCTGLVLNWLFIAIDYDAYLVFLESRLSPDGHIRYPKGALVTVHCAIVSPLLVALLLKNITLPHVRDVHNIGKIACIGTFALIAAGFVLLRSPIYREDGPFETGTALVMLVAAALFVSSSTRQADTQKKLIVLSIAFAYFLFGMEEISWMQRIFNWSTPAFLAQINTQRETNIHNILTPYLPALYWAVCIGLATILLHARSWFSNHLRSSRLYRLSSLLPSSDFTYFGFVFLGLALVNLPFLDAGEITEQTLAIFGIAYAVTLLPNLQRSR